MKNIREITFEARDNLVDAQNLLHLGAVVLSDHEQADDPKIRGVHSLLWELMEKLNRMEKEIAVALKEDDLKTGGKI